LAPIRHASLATSLLWVASLFVLPALATAAAPPEVSVIPEPAKVTAGTGHFVLSSDTRVVADSPQAGRVAAQFAELMRSSGLPVAAGASSAGDSLVFELVAPAALPGAGPEGYVLHVAAHRTSVRASDERGLYYGAITLWQLAGAAPVGTGDASRMLAATTIEDAPRFAWRGFMLDSARHFQSVEEVERVLDIMALHKLNTLHWHLTDDQGWRIEIPRYPKLTEVGGCRVPAGDAGIGADGKPVPYCGWYTQAQIRQVIAYAAARHITIVPEFDVPGHATAAIAAYPRLGVTGKPLAVSNEWGVNSNLFNVDESTLRFLEDVFTEIAALFPGPYVHVGGDEAVKDQWLASPRVQARMKALGIKDVAQLQSYVIKRMEKTLVAHGKRLIGWDEILEGGLPAEATVMSWRGIEGGIEAARQGHDVVMSPSSELYLDYLQTDLPGEAPGRPALIPLQQVYAFEPVPEALDAAQRRHILGLQANLWTEHTRTFARLQHEMLPRLAAVAETGWSPRERKDYASFLQRLPTQLQRYASLGIGYARTPFDVKAAIEGDRATGTATVALSNPLGYPVHYTLDGNVPTPASPTYAAPLALRLPATLSAAAFADGRALDAPRTFRVDAAALLERDSQRLSTCPGSGTLVLRLEDDGPREGDRAIFNADIFKPCWAWKQADLDGIAALRVRAGRIPYYFQLAHDEPARTFEPATTAHGELLLRADACTGEPLARVPLPAEPGADGFATLDVPLPAALAGRHDLCVSFSGDTRPTMWVLDRMTLEPAGR
jgi:hexosaminidase